MITLFFEILGLMAGIFVIGSGLILGSAWIISRRGER